MPTTVSGGGAGSAGQSATTTSRGIVQVDNNSSGTPTAITEAGYLTTITGLTDANLAAAAGIALTKLATVFAVAQGSTQKALVTTGYVVVPVDGTNILHGGATIDNTGVNGNGIRVGTAGTYLIVGSVGATASSGQWIQAGWGKNGTVISVLAGGCNTSQNGSTVIDVTTLLATDVVNLMATVQANVTSYNGFTRLILVRLA